MHIKILLSFPPLFDTQTYFSDFFPMDRVSVSHLQRRSNEKRRFSFHDRWRTRFLTSELTTKWGTSGTARRNGNFVTHYYRPVESVVHFIILSFWMKLQPGDLLPNLQILRDFFPFEITQYKKLFTQLIPNVLIVPFIYFQHQFDSSGSYRPTPNGKGDPLQMLHKTAQVRRMRGEWIFYVFEEEYSRDGDSRLREIVQSLDDDDRSSD